MQAGFWANHFGDLSGTFGGMRCAAKNHTSNTAHPTHVEPMLWIEPKRRFEPKGVFGDLRDRGY